MARMESNFKKATSENSLLSTASGKMYRAGDVYQQGFSKNICGKQLNRWNKKAMTGCYCFLF